MAHAQEYHLIPEIPQKGQNERKDVASSRKLVGAGSLNMTGLLALVANPLAASLGSAIPGDVANLAAC